MEDQKSEGGIKFGLLDFIFPLFLPVKGVAWVSQQLMEQAERELTDKSRIKEELLNLQMQFEMDEISEEEFKKKEAKLLEELESIRKYEEEKR